MWGRRGLVALVFQSEGRGFDSQPWRVFLQQEIYPHCAALNPGEENGYPVGRNSSNARAPVGSTAIAGVIIMIALLLGALSIPWSGYVRIINVVIIIIVVKNWNSSFVLVSELMKNCKCIVCPESRTNITAVLIHQLSFFVMTGI